MEIKKVGVAGCGIMGSGIAQVCAQAGYQVVILEANKDFLDKGMGGIGARLGKGVEKGKISAEDKDATLGRLQGTTQAKDFADCDLVIEAIIENIDAKKKLFADLDGLCPEHTILATNTSVMSIIDMAAATKRPDRVLGLHFFNPAHIMQLVEVVSTIVTSEATAATCVDFVKSIGKTATEVKDTPGFVVNRLFIAFVLNAIRMLEAGIATREGIDQSVKLGLNYPMGPLEVTDMAGIDTLYYISCDLYDKLKDPAYAPPVLLQKMVAAGWYGRKSGRGFYEYDK
ncbi:3-hydroxyacyl-CoA dehydrogenase family protein [Chloroflexota bacterium]